MKKLIPSAVLYSMKRTSLAALTALCALLGTLTSASAQAEAASSARKQRLGALNAKEIKLLMPFLERGPVSLVEFAEGDDLPAVIVGSLVEAPVDRVAKVVSAPENYPRFMPTLDEVKIKSRRGPQTSYEWTWRTGIIQLEGDNVMTAYPPKKGHEKNGHRIAVTSDRGHMGSGRLMWRVIPVGPARTLLILSMRMDLRDANFVMRQLDAAARSINRSVNLSLGYVMVLGTKAEAERQVGYVRPPTKVPFDAPKLNVLKYSKLLTRGDLLFMELRPSRLGKIAIVGRTGLRRKHLRPVMTEPETFGKSLVPGSHATVTERTDKRKVFEWGIRLPLVGTEGKMALSEHGSVVRVDAIDGAMKGGKWRFDTKELPTGEAVVIGWSVFDITNTTWLIKKIAEVDPIMGHGMAAASQVMVLRALRNRARKEALGAAAGNERGSSDKPGVLAAP